MQRIEPGGTSDLQTGLETVAKLARAPTTENVNRLISIDEDIDHPAAARVAACCAILDLALGPPAETIEIISSDVGFKETRTHA